MDPVSVLGVVSGAVSLVALAVSTKTYLFGLKDSYDHAELVILDLITTCQAFEIAWRRVHNWANDHLVRSKNEDPIFGEIMKFQKNSNIVLGALHSELEQLQTSSKIPWRLSPKSKARMVLHEKDLKAHGDRLNHQINSLSLLLAAAQLPSPEIQKDFPKAPSLEPTTGAKRPSIPIPHLLHGDGLNILLLEDLLTIEHGSGILHF